MKLSTKRVDIKGEATEVLLTHKNNPELTWNVSVLDKTSRDAAIDIFAEINAYWAKQTDAAQDGIYAAYAKIHAIFQSDSGYVTQALNRELIAPLNELLSYHKLDAVRRWVTFHSQLQVPREVPDNFDQLDDGRAVRERTYVKDDFWSLLSLIVVLRSIVPIWGEYINRTWRDSGAVYKEHNAALLLLRSDLGRSDPLMRLRNFIEQSIPQDKDKAPAIFGGLSTDAFPEWMLGLVLLRRLTVMDIRGVTPESHVVKNVYRYVQQKTKGHDNNFVGTVRTKDFKPAGTDGDSNISGLEAYKNKHELSEGDIRMIVHSIARLDRILIERVKDEKLVQLLQQSEQSVQVLITEPLIRAQIALAQWTLASYTPPRGADYLDKISLVRYVALAQALLWHRGHHELAALMTAIQLDQADAQQAFGTDSRARIPTPRMEELNAMYPCGRQLSAKTRVIRPGHEVRLRNNHAVEAINRVAQDLSAHAWRLTLPPDWIATVTGNPTTRRYAVPHDIKIKLADLVASHQLRSI